MTATAALVPTTSSDIPASTVASPPIGAPVSIEEHRAAVLQRRDQAERLGDDIAELAARIQAATYELLVMIRAFDQREGWSGFKSCAHWLNWRTGLALGAAREKVRVARVLGDLPLLSEAMQRGRISYSKVRALTRVATPANERRLLDFALCAPASYVERLARAWRRVDLQEEAGEERRRHERRNLTTWVDDDGMLVIRGRLSPEAGAVVRRALEAAGDQLRTDVSPEEAADTSFGQRQADALSLVAESALAGDRDRPPDGLRRRHSRHGRGCRWLGPRRRPEDPHHSPGAAAGAAGARPRVPVPRLQRAALRCPSRPPLGRRRCNAARQPGAALPPPPPSAPAPPSARAVRPRR